MLSKTRSVLVARPFKTAINVTLKNGRSYGNRPIRVQMRDMFPPRSGYRMRGRGFYRRPNFEPRMFADFHRPHVSMRIDNTRLESGGDKIFNFASTHLNPSNMTLGSNSHAQHSHTSSTVDTDSLRHSGASIDVRSDRSQHRESDTRTSVSLTPPPSHHSAPHSSTAAPQGGPLTPHPASQHHQVGYYSPHGWTSGYGPQFPYPVAYGAYGGPVSPAAVPVLAAPAPQGSENAHSPGPSLAPWGSAVSLFSTR